VSLKSLNIRWALIPVVTGTATPAQPGRVLVVYDRNPNGVSPVYSELILSQTTGGSTNSATLDNINLANRDRFVILKDFTLMLPPVEANFTTTQGTPAILNGVETGGNWWFDLRGLTTIYGGTSSAISSIQSGALWLVTAAADTQAPSVWRFQCATRIRYTDG